MGAVVGGRDCSDTFLARRVRSYASRNGLSMLAFVLARLATIAASPRLASSFQILSYSRLFDRSTLRSFHWEIRLSGFPFLEEDDAPVSSIVGLFARFVERKFPALLRLIVTPLNAVRDAVPRVLPSIDAYECDA